MRRLGAAGSLAARAAGWDRLVGPALLLSLALLAAGVVLPAITVNELIVLSGTYSLAETVFKFLDLGNYLLFAVTFTFTLVVPFAKTVAALALWYLVDGDDGRAGRLAARLADLSKWSMLDVFVIALLVVLLADNPFASFRIEPGLFFFAGAVVLSSLGLQRLTRRLAAAR